MKPIAIGCDEAAYDLKEQIKAHLADQGIELVDFGTFDSKAVLYPDIAIKLAESVSAGEQDRGILLCGTGIGMAISANKVPGIRLPRPMIPIRPSGPARAMTPRS